MINLKQFKHGLLPALLIHLSIGFVYSWSVLAKYIAIDFGMSEFKIQFAFSIAIFVLGMSAAFGGKLVERNIKLSALMSMICFILGLYITIISTNIQSYILLLFGYGILMGIGLGIGYITPIKTLILWFPKNKGFATGCAVTGFGLASSIASPLLNKYIPIYGVSMSVMVLSMIYFIMLLSATILIKKPSTIVPLDSEDIKIKDIISDKNFILIWIIMFINILCGISVISYSLKLMNNTQYEYLYWIVLLFMGILNGSGRLLIAWASDYLANRTRIFLIMFLIACLSSLYCMVSNNWFVIASFILIISAIYGGGFSCLPLVINEKFGITHLSQIHGLALTAWAFAGLLSNPLMGLIESVGHSFTTLFFTIVISLYSIGFIIAFKLQINKK